MPGSVPWGNGIGTRVDGGWYPGHMAEDTDAATAREDDLGVAFCRDADGERSTSAVGRAVVAAALRDVDPAGADAVLRTTSWRSGYLPHVRRLTSAGMSSRRAATTIARDGLAELDRQMVVETALDGDVPLTTWLDGTLTQGLSGQAATGTADPETELTVPFRGERLAGDRLRLQLDTWVAEGIVEPSFAAAIREVVANPEWLRLEGRTVAVVGAGAEMGPTTALLRWGATVAAVDRPEAGFWDDHLGDTHASAGTLLSPVLDDEPRPGADVVRHAPTIADWLADLDGELVVSNMVYAPGSAFVRVAVAADLVTRRVLAARPDTRLAFLATPTDVYGVPGEVVDAATAAHEDRGTLAKVLGRPLRTLSAGRLLQRPYAKGVRPGVFDALVPQQGPNYALAKRLQRWRAVVARAEGTPVSLHVAPSTRTRSVTRNRVLAAAYAGAHRFGIEVFEPSTTNTLMAALLVHDLHTGPLSSPDTGFEHVWQDEGHAAAHGGLWTCRYSPSSVLGISALLGLGGARG